MIAKQEYLEQDKSLVGMNKRAQLAEIILGLVIVFIINCGCIQYCKINNQKATAE
jgi:hypothetical protein